MAIVTITAVQYAEALREAGARALREAAQYWAECPDDVGETEADVRNWLRDRADEIEAGR